MVFMELPGIASPPIKSKRLKEPIHLAGWESWQKYHPYEMSLSMLTMNAALRCAVCAPTRAVVIIYSAILVIKLKTGRMMPFGKNYAGVCLQRRLMMSPRDRV